MKYIPIIILILGSCSFATKQETTNTNQENVERIFKTSHFNIFYTELDDENITEISDSLENNYDRIVNHLQAENQPVVNVNFYSHITHLQKAVKDVEPNLPSFAIGLATSVSEIYILSPNHPNYPFQFMVTSTIHEFAHCVSTNVNNTIPNNPRWLWESVAIYEAKQHPNPQNIVYLKEQNPPSLQALSLFTNTYVYDVGYFIAEFIIEEKGINGLNELILNNGDLQHTMNMNEQEFTQAWFSFVKNKYGV